MGTLEEIVKPWWLAPGPFVLVVALAGAVTVASVVADMVAESVAFAVLAGLGLF